MRKYDNYGTGVQGEDRENWGFFFKYGEEERVWTLKSVPEAKQEVYSREGARWGRWLQAT